MRIALFIFSLTLPTLLLPIQVFAQNTESFAPTAPTSFGTTIDPKRLKHSADISKNSSSLQQKDYGGLGKSQTLSIRGSRANDSAIFLEGIPLNSAASGDFDFGLVSPRNFGSTRVIRGGYSPTSTSPSGQILLQLPETDRWKTSAAFGSYRTLESSLLSPYGSLSIDRAENDFPYSDNGVEQKRNNNASFRMNARSWIKTKNAKIWAQILYSDVELPGPLYYLTPHAETETLQPLLAANGYFKHWEWSVWGRFQNQIYQNKDAAEKSTNRWWSSGVHTKRDFAVTNSLQFQVNTDWSQDFLWSDSRNASGTESWDTPVRHTVGLSLGTFWSPIEELLIHPRLRIEFISDLGEEMFSAHPGVGIKWSLSENLSLLSNLAYISRAPNFNEMYFKAGSFFAPNKDLERQYSVQGDMGYEYSAKWGNTPVRLQQAIFFDRTSDLIQNNLSVTPITAKNVGTAYNLGLESEFSLQPHRYILIEASHTLQRSQLGDKENIYKPRHQLNLRPILFPDEWLSLSLPFYNRSSVKTSAGKIKSQWDLGLELTATFGALEAELALMNLLAKNRIEIEGFPLSNETSVRASIGANF